MHLVKFLRQLPFSIKDIHLFRKALVHPSAEACENGTPFQRLEFLGDSVLGLVIGEMLFKQFPESDEGVLTKIRSFLIEDAFLFQVSEKIGLKTILTVGQGVTTKDWKKILADSFEAFIGAIYLDQSYDIVHDYVIQIYNEIFREEGGIIVLKERINSFNLQQNPIGQIQEQLQKEGFPVPTYDIMEDSDLNDGLPVFTATISFETNRGQFSYKGTGRNKKNARKIAAQEALYHENEWK
ncbi:MAG: ribonuclease III family protein [Candidatus Helarchaeota archaeon]